jgi:hypothetical protein
MNVSPSPKTKFQSRKILRSQQQQGSMRLPPFTFVIYIYTLGTLRTSELRPQAIEELKVSKKNVMQFVVILHPLRKKAYGCRSSDLCAISELEFYVKLCDCLKLELQETLCNLPKLDVHS